MNRFQQQPFDDSLYQSPQYPPQGMYQQPMGMQPQMGMPGPQFMQPGEGVPFGPGMETGFGLDARLDRIEREIVEINRRVNNLTRRVRRIEGFLNIRDNG